MKRNKSQSGNSKEIKPTPSQGKFKNKQSKLNFSWQFRLFYFQ